MYNIIFPKLVSPLPSPINSTIVAYNANLKYNKLMLYTVTK